MRSNPATEPLRPEGRTIEVVTSTGNAGILPAINDYSGLFAGKMPAFPVEVTDKAVLFDKLGGNEVFFTNLHPINLKNHS